MPEVIPKSHGITALLYESDRDSIQLRDYLLNFWLTFCVFLQLSPVAFYAL